ncbi:unnamed protein product, partial [Acidithrix sp. C25]
VGFRSTNDAELCSVIRDDDCSEFRFYTTFSLFADGSYWIVAEVSRSKQNAEL